MTEKKSKHPLLKSLLAPLLQEWGYDTVQQSLADIHAEQAYRGPLLGEHGRKPTKEYRRPSASETVERLDVAVDQKEPLRALASRFDAKTFLPTASDVRHFLEMRGQDPGIIKQRQDSFRKVLDVLLKMPDDELMLIRASGPHMGPTQLGPLSDAIKATSAAVRTGESNADSTAVEKSVDPRVDPVGDRRGGDPVSS
jgi:hypothetical protein